MNKNGSVTGPVDAVPGTVGKDQIDEIMQRVRSKENKNRNPEDSDD